ncbi:hypothetical protein [Malikia granosa]|uniref:hypothetical protein n=1 Tax=Malikia granosa TaxID=263067 RepID=UPI0011B0822A|nr:hypothetical protein [Malikia granosa]
MRPLILQPGSALLRVLASTNNNQEHEDVSARAVEFLFAPLELDANVTVRDLFGLFATCPDLLLVYRRFYAEEFCAYAAKGALTAEGGNTIERVEMYRAWDVNSKTGAYSEVPMLRLSALGRCPAGQEATLHPDANGMVHYSLDGADLRYLLDVPLHFNSQVKVYEADGRSNRFGQCVSTVSCTDLSLGEVLQAMLWSLSWFGGPEKTQDFFEHIQAMDKDRENWDEASLEELMEEQFGGDDRRGCAALFESTGSCKPMEVSSALREIPDQDNAQQWLQQHLNEGISVKPAYCQLSGRDFRQAFFEAQVQE